MKREDIYIEVTPDTIGAYVAVLKKHGEPVGDVDTTKTFRILKIQAPSDRWFVGFNLDYSREPTFNWTPEQLDQWLTEQKAAESKGVHAEPSEPAERTVYAYQCGAFEPVTLCDDYAVVCKANGEKIIVSRKQLYVGDLTPLMP